VVALPASSHDTEVTPSKKERVEPEEKKSPSPVKIADLHGNSPEASHADFFGDNSDDGEDALGQTKSPADLGIGLHYQDSQED
jgi:hypothetical protein